MNGRLTGASRTLESSIFAFSDASFSRCSAMRSLRRSTPCSLAKSNTSHSRMRLSKSSPPRYESPPVARTSNTPLPISSTEMSKVPPPRSKTATLPFTCLPKPYAKAAAVGSLMMRSTSSPAMVPASLVA